MPSTEFSSDLDQLLPEGLGERYRPLQILGRGAFGQVLLARDRSLDRLVAVKVYTGPARPKVAGAGSSAHRRFIREARATAGLRHPSVVQVLDFDADIHGGSAYILYEYIGGGTLGQALDRHGPPAPARLRAWVGQVARGLAALHGAGLVHRDVKPENLLLRRSGELVLADLGLVRALEGSDFTQLTASGVAPGTMAYMAPELWLGAEATPASDQWALGAVLYRCLYGESLHGEHIGPEAGARLQGLTHIDPPADLRAPADDLAVLCRRMLAREPEERLPSMEAVLQELESPSPRPLPRPPPPSVLRPPAPLGRPWSHHLALASIGVGFGLALGLAADSSRAPAPPPAPVASQPVSRARAERPRRPRAPRPAPDIHRLRLALTAAAPGAPPAPLRVPRHWGPVFAVLEDEAMLEIWERSMHAPKAHRGGLVPAHVREVAGALQHVQVSFSAHLADGLVFAHAHPERGRLVARWPSVRRRWRAPALERLRTLRTSFDPAHLAERATLEGLVEASEGARVVPAVISALEAPGPAELRSQLGTALAQLLHCLGSADFGAEARDRVRARALAAAEGLSLEAVGALTSRALVAARNERPGAERQLERWMALLEEAARNASDKERETTTTFLERVATTSWILLGARQSRPADSWRRPIRQALGQPASVTPFL